MSAHVASVSKSWNNYACICVFVHGCCAQIHFWCVTVMCDRHCDVCIESSIDSTVCVIYYMNVCVCVYVCVCVCVWNTETYIEKF